MGLGKTFTNSIVREVGRNYGKAISNSLLGDKHSTPHRIVGNNSVDRKRGRIYHNDLDKAIQKFEIKGHQATFNQALNIHSEFFQLVDEANADGSINLNEIVFLVKSSRLDIPTLERAKGALIDHDKQDVAEKVNAKIIDISDFIKTLNDSLDVNQLPIVKFKPMAALFGILSFWGVDRLYFSPKDFKSYVFAAQRHKQIRNGFDGLHSSKNFLGSQCISHGFYFNINNISQLPLGKICYTYCSNFPFNFDPFMVFTIREIGGYIH